MKSYTNLSPRRQHTREAMTLSILQAARHIMREEGVAALTMQGLARRMEMRAPSLYNYFTGKMDIYDALFRMGFQLYADQAEAYIRPAQTWQEEVRLIMEAYMAFALQNPELYQLCFERPVPGFVPSAGSMQFVQSRLQVFYENAYRIYEQLETDLTPNQVVDMVVAMMHGLTAQHLSNEPHLPLGQGRFGSLIPHAVSILDKSWQKSS